MIHVTNSCVSSLICMGHTPVSQDTTGCIVEAPLDLLIIHLWTSQEMVFPMLS